eukprot:4121062-Amphidinium_carterae.1
MGAVAYQIQEACTEAAFVLFLLNLTSDESVHSISWLMKLAQRIASGLLEQQMGHVQTRSCVSLESKEDASASASAALLAPLQVGNAILDGL